MESQKREESNNFAQECSEYEPILVAKNLSMEFGEDQIEDAGCDSCVHCHNGECGIYKRRKY